MVVVSVAAVIFLTMSFRDEYLIRFLKQALNTTHEAHAQLQAEFRAFRRQADDVSERLAAVTRERNQALTRVVELTAELRDAPHKTPTLDLKWFFDELEEIFRGIVFLYRTYACLGLNLIGVRAVCI